MLPVVAHLTPPVSSLALLRALLKRLPWRVLLAAACGLVGMLVLAIPAHGMSANPPISQNLAVCVELPDGTSWLLVDGEPGHKAEHHKTPHARLNPTKHADIKHRALYRGKFETVARSKTYRARRELPFQSQPFAAQKFVDLKVQGSVRDRAPPPSVWARVRNWLGANFDFKIVFYLVHPLSVRLVSGDRAPGVLSPLCVVRKSPSAVLPTCRSHL